MKTSYAQNDGRGFTLIELLVVIAVIALLAGMIFPITGAVNRTKIRAKARAEIQQIVSAIEDYKAKLGHYPPDNANPNWKHVNPLYFELLGTSFNGTAYQTLDGSQTIPVGGANGVTASFGLSGFVNSMRGTAAEEGRVAESFIKGLRFDQHDNVPNAQGGQAHVLLCSIRWNPPGTMPMPNPFRYNSSNPTNNPNSFDLWVDVMVGGKTNRVSNWSTEPMIVSTP